jgi:nucleoside-diphosphate-sugar epimerase
MNSGLIGATGFVGGTLLRQRSFDDQYHSRNIHEIAGREYELLVCAGAPAEKWKANKEPAADRENLARLMDQLRRCQARSFVLISTVDVYKQPRDVDENTTPPTDGLQPYGLHRLELEDFVRQTFPLACIVRLPALFGIGLKKNFIYDLLHDNCLDWTDHRSEFQFYDLSRLWADVEVALRQQLTLVNFATGPVRVAEIARRCFDREFTNTTANGPVYYDMRTCHAQAFGGQEGYLYSAEESYQRIRTFVQETRAKI